MFYLGDGRANVGQAVSTASLARTGRNLKDFYDRFLEEPQLAAWLENATPEGPPTSWSLKMGMWGAKRYDQGLAVGDASMVHPISGEGVGYALESGRLAASWANEAYVRKDFSASVLSGYERQLKRRRAREHLSGYALVKLVPNLMLLEPLFKACEKEPEARRTLLGGFYRETRPSTAYSNIPACSQEHCRIASRSEYGREEHMVQIRRALTTPRVANRAQSVAGTAIIWIHDQRRVRRLGYWDKPSTLHGCGSTSWTTAYSLQTLVTSSAAPGRPASREPCTPSSSRRAITSCSSTPDSDQSPDILVGRYELRRDTAPSRPSR